MAKTMNRAKPAVSMDSFLATLQNTTAKPIAQTKSKLPAVNIGELMGCGKPDKEPNGKPDKEPIQVNSEPAEAVDVSLKNAEMPTASFLQPTSLEAKDGFTQQKAAATNGETTSEKNILRAKPGEPESSSESGEKVDAGIADLVARAMKAKKTADESAELTMRAQARVGSELAAVFHGNSTVGDTFAAAFGKRLNTAQGAGSLKVAAYIRVSSDSSDQENSYETQERYFSQLLQSNPSWVSAGVYSDYGISGTTKDKRTGFKRLLRHCREGKIDRIFCKSISRFARNTEDFVVALRTLKENNVSIFFERESLDTTDSVSDFILTTLGAIAQEESRSISANIRWGMQKRFPKGQVRNFDIYGYRYTGEMVETEDGYRYRDIEIVEEEAEIVRRIFREVADGEKYTDIARKLNYEHIPAPLSKCKTTRQKNGDKGWLKPEIEEGWTGRLISDIVHQERYVGDVIIQKTFTTDHLSHKVCKNRGEMEMYHIQGHHPAIVSRELYEDAMKVLKLNANIYGKNHMGERHKHAFSQRLLCAHCGRFYTVYNSGQNPIWVCPSSKLNNGKSVCKSERIYEEQIVRMFRKAAIDRFHLAPTPIVDNVSAADIMSGRYKDSSEMLSLEAEGFVAQMRGRLESIQRHDNMERDRGFLKRRITAVQLGIEQTRKQIRLLKSQVDAMKTRAQFLGDESITAEMIEQKQGRLREEEERLEKDEAEEKSLSERLSYLESYWNELENDYERREDAINWMGTLPQGRDGTAEFLNGLTADYVKAFVLSVTIHSPLKYTVHWFDDTRTEVEMYSNIEDYRYTSSWIRKHG